MMLFDGTELSAKLIVWLTKVEARTEGEVERPRLVEVLCTTTAGDDDK